MKRILLSLFIFYYFSHAFAEVSLQLESPTVQLGQTFTLTLKMEGSQANSVPDLTPLQQDFNIIGTESNMNYSIINGQAHAATEWTISLTAKRSGVFPIPALQVGQEKTAPISIKITQKTPSMTQPFSPQGTTQSSSQQSQDVMLKTEVNVDKPYVNQQVIYTVKLFNSRRLLDANYQPPSVEDALLVPLGDGRRYQLMSNGRIYAVEEQQFALFPQKSGVLNITPPSFSALIDDAMPKRVSAQVQPIALKVKPIPAGYKGKNWLPAKQVTLSEHYDKSTVSLSEGSTLIRTVVLQANAVPAQLLPALDFDGSSEFSLYPEKPSEITDFKQQDLVGTTTVKVTYLLNKAGKITIPALAVPWFNTTTGKEEISTLPALTINVTAAPGGTQTNKVPDSSTAVQSPQITTTLPRNEKIEIKPQTNNAWWFAGGFALAWLVTLAAWFWCQPRQLSLNKNKKQILKELQGACLNNNPSQARDALLRWGRLQWPAATLLNLIDLEKWVDDQQLKQQINRLSDALYRDLKLHPLWQGGELWRCILAFKTSGSGRNNQANPLPPLHRL